jgi:hypothetical protein
MIVRLLYRISLLKIVCERALEWRGSGVKTKKMLEMRPAPLRASPEVPRILRVSAVNVPHDNEMWDTKFLGLSVASAH